ncbi:hypothetical protein ACM61V_04205 [Sphingomonas sp. TX0543]|nr:hypothetical protein [Sphingomonas sp. 3P27F8]
MRLEIAYVLLALFVIGLATALVLFIRHRRRERERIWGRRKNQR